MSLKAATVKNLGIVTGLQVFVSSLNAVTMIVLARLLTPFDFGIIAIAGFLLGFIGQFKDFGLGAAVIQRKDRVEESMQTGAALRIIIGLAIFIIAFLSAPLVAVMFSAPEATDVVRVLSITLLIGSFGFIPTNALAKRLEFKKIAIAGAAGAIVTSTVAITLAYIGFSYWALVYASVLATIASLVALSILFPWKISFKINKQLGKEMFRYGIHVFLMVLMVFLITNLDNAAIGIVLGAVALGYYFIAYRWASVFANFLTAIVDRVMFPTYSRIQDDERRLKTGYLQTVEMISLVGVPLYLGFIIVVPEFVVYLLGDKWVPSIVALEILCLFGLTRVILQPAGSLFLAKGKSKWLSTTNTGLLLSVIVFLYPAILWAGIEGVAFMMFVLYFFSAIVILWLVTQLLRIRFIDITSRFADPLVASIGMFIVVLVFKVYAGFSLTTFLASIVIGAVVYSLLIYALAHDRIRYYLTEMKSLMKRSA